MGSAQRQPTTGADGGPTIGERPEVILELGHRLVERGHLQEADDVFEATAAEVKQLAAGDGGPNGARVRVDGPAGTVTLL